MIKSICITKCDRFYYTDKSWPNCFCSAPLASADYKFHDQWGEYDKVNGDYYLYADFKPPEDCPFLLEHTIDD